MNHVESNPKLIIACWATLGVLLAMVVIFLRYRRRHFALGVLPLALPAVTYLFSGIIARWIDPALSAASSVQIRVVLDLIAALIACVLIGLIATVVTQSRSSRLFFITACSLFVSIFSSILIINTALQINT